MDGDTVVRGAIVLVAALLALGLGLFAFVWFPTRGFSA